MMDQETYQLLKNAFDCCQQILRLEKRLSRLGKIQITSLGWCIKERLEKEAEAGHYPWNDEVKH